MYEHEKKIRAIIRASQKAVREGRYPDLKDRLHLLYLQGWGDGQKSMGGVNYIPQSAKDLEARGFNRINDPRRTKE